MQNWRDECVVDGEKPVVDSRDEGKHTVFQISTSVPDFLSFESFSVTL